MTGKPPRRTVTKNAQQREPRGKQASTARNRSGGPRPVTPKSKRTTETEISGIRPQRGTQHARVASGSKVRELYPRRAKKRLRDKEPWKTLFFAVRSAPIQQKRRRADRYIFGVTVLLVLYGLAMIYAASSFRLSDPLGGVKKQAMYAGLGIILMVILPLFDYHSLLSLAWCLSYIAGIVLIGATMVVGRTVNGSARWIQVGGISIQPSELMKTALILFFSVYLVKEYRRLAEHPWKVFWVMALWGGIPAFLVARQNLSTGILIASLVFIITFLGVKDNRVHFLLMALGGLAFWFVLNNYKHLSFLKAYQIARIDKWLNPPAVVQGDPGQVMKGIYALSEGGLRGTGIGRGYIKRNLAEASNDIILAVVGEELGLIGICILLVFYLSLLFCIIQTAVKAPDRYGALLCGGVAIHIFLHTAMNIAVVTGAMPNTGVTLPFVSSGGTSLLCFMAEIGLVLSVSRSVRPESSP